ncbi:hypothetical protein COT97_01875 [Candidatus Falkowbacteria bacterium CG10_big_fil_rev_8_21_14_0_10_39_11]|uniref:Bacterial sugar transferase domain-containing protein n=1 Tax=Candidatus Falkowbacteria bacterium CG10_big_fil_rev_8_21_14_0_10_39_11 TaxID=1974565 RepID=A0A2H0V5K3_9BACT|nr:MAG: hypothetical protein COT97_01875 [Candidatus Falkowbacteria bacterium CG10_big_fil_rev_8_21_14_0_10_39_11]
MRKKAELFFTAIKLPLDYLALVLAGVIAYQIRTKDFVRDIRPIVFDLKPQEILNYSMIVALLGLIFFIIAGLYTFRRLKITDELGKIILATSSVMSAVIIYMFFIRESFDSRFIILTAWILSIIFVTLFRIIIRKLAKILSKFGIGMHRVIIVGKNENTEEIIETLKLQPELGMKIVKIFDTISEDMLEELKNSHSRKFIDEIIQTDSSLSRSKSVDLINFAEENNIIFKYAAGLFETRTTNIDVHMLAGVPIVEIRKTKLDGWGKIAKRVLDSFFSLILIIIFSPIMLITWLSIRFTSRGPAIFKNERVNRRGTFNVYKFRSMKAEFCVGKQFEKYTDQEKIIAFEKKLIAKQSKRQGPVYKILNDPRRTKVGRFLEKTSLDELPQLFNVLIGTMSLVGPRPHQPREVAKYERHHKRVLDIKPGITGLAQISGRSDLDFEDEVKLDTYYIENWSLKLDLWILLKTPFAVLIRKHKN